MKNIGIPQNETYLLQLIEKIEMVIKRMKWKIIFNRKKETNGVKIEWYRLKQVKDLMRLRFPEKDTKSHLVN